MTAPKHYGERVMPPNFASNVRIALIVSESDAAAREAHRYVSALPKSASLILYAPRPARDTLKAVAREIDLPLTTADNATSAVAMANVVVIFGHSPFTEDDVLTLSSQGISVHGKELPRPTYEKSRGRGV